MFNLFYNNKSVFVVGRGRFHRINCNASSCLFCNFNEIRDEFLCMFYCACQVYIESIPLHFSSFFHKPSTLFKHTLIRSSTTRNEYLSNVDKIPNSGIQPHIKNGCRGSTLRRPQCKSSSIIILPRRSFTFFDKEDVYIFEMLHLGQAFFIYRFQ